MDPGGAPVGNRTFPPWSARHEIVQPKMAEFVTAVGGKDHVARGRRGDQSTQCFKPTDEATTSLGGRLPPRAARRHNHQRRREAPVATHYDDHVAGSCRNAL